MRKIDEFISLAVRRAAAAARAAVKSKCNKFILQRIALKDK
jgi:hypothetical protein